MSQPEALLGAHHDRSDDHIGAAIQHKPSTLGRVNRASARHRMRRDLHRSIDRSELIVHYQPVWDLINGELSGTEALVRWQHPVLGLLGPDRFIAVAEQSGFIAELGAWVLDQACADAVNWQQPGHSVSVAVNLSARQFDLQAVDELVESVLIRTGLAPECLDLELTESIPLADLGEATVSMRRLRELGVRCSIDDFGTGYTALSYLSALPVTGLKIDRSFVSTLHQNDTSAPIMRAMVAMAADLGLGVVAEGVEHPHQLEFLQASGCQLAQGFLLGHPMGPTDMHTLVIAGTTRRRNQGPDKTTVGIGMSI